MLDYISDEGRISQQINLLAHEIWLLKMRVVRLEISVIKLVILLGEL